MAFGKKTVQALLVHDDGKAMVLDHGSVNGSHGYCPQKNTFVFSLYFNLLSPKAAAGMFLLAAVSRCY